MYWSRTGSIPDLLSWLLLCGLWWIGGWLLGTHVFGLRSRERLLAGGAIGILLFILLSNILGHIPPLSGAKFIAAQWNAAVIILASGLAVALRAPAITRENNNLAQSRFPIRTSIQPWQILGFSALLFLFVSINRGLAIFDDFANLPIVSTMAAGDFPPHFHLNPEQRMDYHYGLHLFAASLARIGGFFPWSAFDLGKALSTTLALFLAWLWLRRLNKHWLTLLLGTAIIMLAGGSRWLLLLAPEGWLQRVSEGIQLQGSALQTGPDLYNALPFTWKIEGDGPFPFSFAFTNGIFSPLFLALSGSGALPQMTLFTLLLLARRNWTASSGLIYGLLLTSLALTGEHLFLMLWGGTFLAAVVGWLAHRRRTLHNRKILGWFWVLLPGLLLVPIMGGVLTEFFERTLLRLGGQAATSSVALPELGLRWPPAFISAHLGSLSLTSPGQIIVALAEMGPVLLLAPLVSLLIWKYIRQGKWFPAGLGIAALLGFLAPMFISFSQRERDLSRLSGAALFIWLVLGMPYIWLALRRGGRGSQVILTGVVLLTVFGGLALFPSNLIAIARTQPSFFVEEPDALMSVQYWDQLDPDAQIIDLGYIHRAPTLFGRSAGRAYENIYIRLPEYRELLANPDPVQIAKAGYSYIYLDKQTWLAFSNEQRQAFQTACVRIMDEKRTEMNDFRRLLDVRACQ